MDKILSHKRRGFTLVELVVVCGIIAVIMTVVVFNSRKMNDGLALKTAANEVSLAMRQAQNFGISVREASPGQFNAPYGVWFDLLNPTNIFIYSDNNNNRAYNGSWDCAGSDECRERIPLRAGVRINRMCTTYMNDVLTCFASNFRSSVLTYVRPNPEPVIKTFDTSNVEITGPWKKFYLELVSQQGTMMYVVTDSVSGQITIQKNIP